MHVILYASCRRIISSHPCRPRRLAALASPLAMSAPSFETARSSPSAVAEEATWEVVEATSAVEVEVAEEATSAEATSAVVEEKLWTWADLERIVAQQPKQVWHLNSHALKYARFLGEDPAGVPKAHGILGPFDFDELTKIGAIEHAPKGPGFSFNTPAVAGRFVDWSPAQFLTNMRPDTLAKLGLQDHGVKKLVCWAFPESTDFKRMTAAKQGGQTFGPGVTPVVWDFILTRGDGEVFALHPDWKGNKVGIMKMNEATQRRAAQASEGLKIRHWIHDSYPELGHGRYQEGLDEVRDQHRRRQLEEHARRRAASAASQSPGVAPGEAASSAVAAASSAVAEPAPRPPGVWM